MRNSALPWVTAAVVSFFVLTVSSTGHAFSVLPSYYGSPTRWNSPVIELRLSAEATQLLESDGMRAAALMAQAAWRGYPGVPDIEIASEPAEPFDSSDDVNGVYVVSPWPYEADKIALTFPRRTLRGEIISADVVLNGDVDWGVLPEDQAPPPSRHDLPSILTHEFGHVLGLGESEVSGATMWPTTALGETHKRVLSADDEEGVMHIYGSPLPAAPQSCTVVGDPAAGERSGGVGWLCAICAGVLGGRWRRRSFALHGTGPGSRARS